MSIADDAGDSGLWLPLGEIARRRGVTKQALSKRLARLVARGAAVPTRRHGRRLLINVAALDRAIGDDSFLQQTQSAATVRMFDEPLLLAPSKGVRSLLEVQREKLLYDTGLVALKYAEARGEVVPIAGEHGLERATREIGDAFRQAVGRLHLRAPELTAVATKDGVAGVRGLLKAAERDLLGSFATALAALGERGRAIEAAGGFVVELPEPDADATTSAGRGKHDARPIAPLSIVALIRWLRGEIGRWISGGRSKDEDELQGSGDEQAQELFASLANELAAIVKL